MRRWFLVVLAFLVAAQFSWAAAATYCEHETRTGNTAHFGHHAHSHDHDGSAEKPATKVLMQVADFDHGHCHLIHVVISCEEMMGTLAPEHGAPAPDQPARVKSFVPDGLERPNWLRA